MNDLSTILAEIRAMPVKVRRNRAYGLKRKPDADTIPTLLALLGEEYDDDPDRKVHFNAILALEELCSKSVPSLLLEALEPKPEHQNDHWRRYWIVMALRRIENDDAANALIDILENDADRGFASIAAGAFERDSGRVAIIGRDRVLKAARKRIDADVRDNCSRICQKMLGNQEENTAR